MRDSMETAAISCAIIDRATAIADAGISLHALERNDIVVLMAGICAQLVQDHLHGEDTEIFLADLSLVIHDLLRQPDDKRRVPAPPDERLH